MAENPIAKSLAALVPAGQIAVIGVTQEGAGAGVKQNDGPAVQADVTALTTAITGCEQGKVTLTERRAAVRATVESGRDLLTYTRDVLKPRFGSQYSQSWDITGFVDSLMVPTAAADVQFRLERMGAYLAANPTVEVPVLNITATHLQGAFGDLNTARGAVNLQETVVDNLMAARDLAAAKLRLRLAGLRDELGQLLDPLDPRWKAFGFNMPGAQETPDVPEHLQAHSHVAGEVAMQFGNAARAESYHVFMRVIGGQSPDFVLVGSPLDPNFNLTGLTSGTQIELCVTAVNNGGESLKSAVVTVTVM